MTNKKHRRSWFWQIATSICCLWLVGCGGGSGSLSGVTANYEGGSFMPDLRIGELQLQRRNDQLTGTMTVSRVTYDGLDNPRPQGDLPLGTYQISATVTGNNFSGQGSYLGSPAFNLTVNGLLPTSSTVGVMTITGSTTQGAFNYDLIFQTSTGPLGQDGSFSFSNLQNSNVTTTTLTNTVNASLAKPPLRYEISAIFNAPPSSPLARSLFVTLNKNTPFVVGDELPIQLFDGTYIDRSFVFYSENSPVTKQWFSASGSIKVIAINGKKATLQLVNVRMHPQQQLGNQPNLGTGEFTLNGSGSVMQDHAF